MKRLIIAMTVVSAFATLSFPALSMDSDMLKRKLHSLNQSISLGSQKAVSQKAEETQKTNQVKFEETRKEEVGPGPAHSQSVSK